MNAARDTPALFYVAKACIGATCAVGARIVKDCIGVACACGAKFYGEL
ncbi:hypothetical protein [uncultured Campylobacter sp.]|nr:hypothetical protein [uncultured Campylobacter sp.]